MKQNIPELENMDLYSKTRLLIKAKKQSRFTMKLVILFVFTIFSSLIPLYLLKLINVDGFIKELSVFVYMVLVWGAGYRYLNNAHLMPAIRKILMNRD